MEEIKMSKKKEEKKEEAVVEQPEGDVGSDIQAITQEYQRILTYAQSLERTIQDFRQRINVYEAMQTQLLADKKELQGYVLSLENTLNQTRQSTES
jgi:chromosome segregation ATPase|tara:strand:+ start:110 stop:397 length:288 start_codon:yes stop_codon:yes gene_type:complete